MVVSLDFRIWTQNVCKMMGPGLKVIKNSRALCDLFSGTQTDPEYLRSEEEISFQGVLNRSVFSFRDGLKRANMCWKIVVMYRPNTYQHHVCYSYVRNREPQH